MSRRYSFDSEQPPPPPDHHQQYYDPPHSQQQQPQQQYQAYQSQSPPLSPAAHPDSTFNRLQAARRYSRDREGEQRHQSPPVNPFIAPPALPPHRDAEGRFWGRELGYNTDPHNISPGADNFSEHAAGGMVGLARGVADDHPRESGVEAMRHTPGYHPGMEARGRNEYSSGEYDEPPYARPGPRQEQSQSSLTPLGAAAFPPGFATPQSRSEVSRSPHSFNHEPYVDNPSAHRYSRNLDPSLGPQDFDPNSIEDDGDDGLEYTQRHRSSMLSLGHSDRGGATPVAAGAATGAVGGGVLGAIGGLVGRKVTGQSGPQYNAVTDPYAGSAGNYNLGPEKSEWLSKQSSGNKKLRWLVGILIAVAIVGGIAGGIVGGILSKKNSNNSSSGPSGQSAGADTQTNGDLNKDSAEIKALLGNKNLHKVFPGMDYTPMYTQYPDCLSYPASQNNVTRDLAVLSQLTNTVRLYGTDCNQTELLLHSIDQLGLNGTIKVWMGVWLDTNTTTNDRQIAQMYDIFKKHGSASFAGVIVGNEVLFRKDMTGTELGTVISGVKTNLTAMGINIPVASSDLGDNWSANPSLAAEVDILMANIHPFFAGVTAEEASAWTWNFWQTHDLVLKSDLSKNYISETGWPSTGGTDCGGATTCTNGSIAGIPEMNTFMDGWVCPSLTNGTNYFWFEAFDEPWKIKFNEKGKEWEDKWGLLDVNRNLKPGIVIPSCGGKTVS